MFKSLLTKLIQNTLLKNFFAIPLSSIEKDVAIESIVDKYAPSLRNSFLSALLILPAILFLDSSVIVTVLIPITLVAGTAWFSISLANIKQKFEKFGLELTTNVFESFVTSLFILILIASVSLLKPFLSFITHYSSNLTLSLIAALLGVLVIIRNIYQILIGAMKYDINDAMLTGQNEAAEKFFKKSLSFLNITAEKLREGKNLQVANYYIGLSFYEIFTYIKKLNNYDVKYVDKYIARSNKLIDNPIMDQKKADSLSCELIKVFLHLISSRSKENDKSISAIQDELKNLQKKNSKESQEMVDTRLSIIFQEIAELIDSSGENLFKK